MWFKWLPWRMILRSAARRSGFLDPLEIISKLEQFGQPSEVAAPTELLRSGVVLHARGLMNSQAIQHNLDWVWPYWVECQFNPASPAFVPRAFMITHINLTHRNWTAVGIPGYREFPLVDPRGLLTPFFDGWSIDSWLIDEDGAALIPSRCDKANQVPYMEEGFRIDTMVGDDNKSIRSEIQVIGDINSPVCQARIEARSSKKGWLVIALRPYNPEGVSFIHDIQRLEEGRGWKVNKTSEVKFDQIPDQHTHCYYRKGDVFLKIPSHDDATHTWCNVGMATAAAQFLLTPNQSRQVTLEIPLPANSSTRNNENSSNRNLFAKKTTSELLSASESWHQSLKNVSHLDIPDPLFKFLYDVALRTLVLHSPDEVFPGPYTYKRFWFRDAAFILYAMLCSGLKERVPMVIDHFFSKQMFNGYFLSQEGEWDSNGEALWIMEKFYQMTRQPIPPRWMRAIDSGGRWIMRKRLKSGTDKLHAGLLPSGFSAEHLGPNDFYYWDDFWGVAGLKAAANLSQRFGNKNRARQFQMEADDFMSCINQSLYKVKTRLGKSIIPASPYRRMDAGAIGSVVADYPLQIFSAQDPQVMNTAEFLIKKCFYKGGFFQDMTHSGINPYLTLHIAQVLLRAGDPRYFDLMTSIAKLATTTGQWPEAVHPKTEGGCMGDGQHVWAAAEWIMMIRNCFVREENDDQRLVLCSGIPLKWLEQPGKMSYGPTSTLFGPIDISIISNGEEVTVSWQGNWFDAAPTIDIRLPGLSPVIFTKGEKSIRLSLKK
ncbi:MAG: hypothetical protein KBD53_09655 [Candidatus Omnitrophica bacterium]|nr:hypothetical protein [Candidatus Omnitrophota bacterium]